MMLRRLALVLTLGFAGPAGLAQSPAQEGVQPAAAAVSLLPEFDAFALRHANDEPADRVAAFERELAPVLPDFYAPRERTKEGYARQVAEELAAYPVRRTKILAVGEAFNARLANADSRFRQFFPDFALTVPVYLLHSLGEMDGGTRTINGQTALIFGADIIALIHDEGTIGPLFDHELFHTYHLRYFPECGQVWCNLWTEGLAVYVTARLNPGITDRALLLDSPVPLRAAVDAQFQLALQTVREALDDREGITAERMFQGGDDRGERQPLPRRFGYYVGYRVFERLAGERSLEALAKMPPEEVRPLIEQALKEMEEEAGKGETPGQPSADVSTTSPATDAAETD